MTPLVVENEPPVTFLRRKMTGGRFSMGVVIRRYTGLVPTTSGRKIAERPRGFGSGPTIASVGPTDHLQGAAEG